MAEVPRFQVAASTIDLFHARANIVEFGARFVDGHWVLLRTVLVGHVEWVGEWRHGLMRRQFASRMRYIRQSPDGTRDVCELRNSGQELPI